MPLIFNLANGNAPVDIFGNIPLEKLFALSGSPQLPLFQSYNVLFARQPSKEGGGPIASKEKVGEGQVEFSFCDFVKFYLIKLKNV